ncbi:adenylate kinase isoenzyme 6 homolog Fap7p [[Candida] railenensis]|uniref:Adenylate kinase isoenzyme 6 homolog n=1 Tax=[Candida] railenensis TaxID=45579 RepID=A0A9P0QN33_9ASCO|nr:adenylate kinase isoenzyme 6 homolog Fap7p [[Candida] railenensis]
MSRRYQPNIIITGTPGCGKSSHAVSLVSQLGDSYTHLPVSDLAKERDCIDSYDEVLATSVVDEDKLLDSLEIDLEKGGAIVDWHCCDIFPERLIDLVVVLRTDTSLLYDRLSKRDYKNNKIQENLDCEIMEVILNDARESYIPEIVIELTSNSVEEMDENVDRINGWIENWCKDHPEGVTNVLDPELAAKYKKQQEEDSDEELD